MYIIEYIKTGFFLIVFSRKYPIQRCLKKRTFKATRLPKLRFGTVGLYCLYSFRMEYRYCLFLRKFFKRIIKRRRRKIRTCQRKRVWLFIRPNYTLTHKSKNARMGKGKGNFKRWCTIVHPGRVFIEHLNSPVTSYKKYAAKIQKKIKLRLFVISRSKATIKRISIINKLSHITNKLEIVKFRKQLRRTPI